MRKPDPLARTRCPVADAAGGKAAPDPDRTKWAPARLRRLRIGIDPMGSHSTRALRGSPRLAAPCRTMGGKWMGQASDTSHPRPDCPASTSHPARRGSGAGAAERTDHPGAARTQRTGKRRWCRRRTRCLPRIRRDPRARTALRAKVRSAGTPESGKAGREPTASRCPDTPRRSLPRLRTNRSRIPRRPAGKGYPNAREGRSRGRQGSDRCTSMCSPPRVSGRLRIRIACRCSRNRGRASRTPYPGWAGQRQGIPLRAPPRMAGRRLAQTPSRCRPTRGCRA